MVDGRFTARAVPGTRGTRRQPFDLIQPLTCMATAGVEAEERAPTDERLVSAVLTSRSEAAFRQLYHRHTPRLFRVARRMADTPSDAEDAVQETWLRASLQFRDFRWTSALSTWLVGIALNVLREQKARRGRHIDLSLDEIPLAAPGDRDRIDLEAAVRELAPGARIVFLLHDVEGFTHEEIAAQLGVTAGTSKTQLHRARAALRKRLEDYAHMRIV